MAMELSDRSGRIGAIWFGPDSEGAAIPSGTVVRATGRVTSYRGARRVTIDRIAPSGTYDVADLVPQGRTDRTRALARLRRLVTAVRDPELRGLARAVFGEPGFISRFLSCPASQSYHHAHVGGLLDHTVAVGTMAARARSQYPEADADLLLAAALLHDVGKVDELEYDVAIGYTDEGRLLGHVVLGERRIRRVAEASRPKLSGPRMAELSHVVLSHHGELEWGAPKRPCMVEALILHHLDNLDAKVTGFIEATLAASTMDERWTDSTNLFRRPLYAPRPAEDDRPARPSEDMPLTAVAS